MVRFRCLDAAGFTRFGGTDLAREAVRLMAGFFLTFFGGGAMIFFGFALTGFLGRALITFLSLRLGAAFPIAFAIRFRRVFFRGIYHPSMVVWGVLPRLVAPGIVPRPWRRVQLDCRV